MLLVIFILLSIVVLSFLIMISLTLFRIEKTVKLTMMLAEKKIVSAYGYGKGRAPL
jgi:hypothetical protein